MNRLLLLPSALALVAGAVAGPALAEDAPDTYGPCVAPEGATVVTPGADALSRPVETPIGALNAVGTVDAGSVYVDLSGLPKTSSAALQLTLSWDNPVSDYDLVVDGDNALATDNPETRVVTVGHCTPTTLGVEVFYGLPVDALTLETSAVEVPLEEQ